MHYLFHDFFIHLFQENLLKNLELIENERIHLFYLNAIDFDLDPGSIIQVQNIFGFLMNI